MNIKLIFKGQEKEISVKESSGITVKNILMDNYSRDDYIVTANMIFKSGNVDKLVDFDFSIGDEQIDTIEFFSADSSKEGKSVFYHSSAHLLGNALVNLFNAKLVNGPAIDEGFYYDVEVDEPISEKDFKRIENEMMRLAKLGSIFVKEKVSKDYLLEKYNGNKCKLYFLNKIDIKEENEGISVYRNILKDGSCIFEDMCRGPHIQNSAMIKSVIITKSSSCYFLNDAKNASLQRVYGISFPNKALSVEYKDMIKKAAECDHRKLGRELNLFMFHDLSPGSCFWMPDGAHIYHKLIDFMRFEYRKRGFKEVITPNIYLIDLWKTSGHYQNYKENMFMVDDSEFALKSMNCPGHCLLYQQMVTSYRDLPMRLADFGVLHRNECTGSLTGLTRVRRFQQDDAHIFAMRSQIKEEISGCLDFLKYVYSIFNFTYDILLSTRPEEKYIGTIEEWDLAENNLKEAILATGHSYVINEGDGAFYGPKIDIILYDAFNRKIQCATIQLDFQLPQRFNLKYVNSEGVYETPVMIHRAILGSVERFVAVLVESFGRRMPFWLSPKQIRLIVISGEEANYAKEISNKLKDYEVSLDYDYKATLKKRVRIAEVDGHSLVCIVGKNEKANNEINVRITGGGSKNINLEKFISIVNLMVENKKEPNEYFK